MIHFDNLTTREKFMNMAKLGTVSGVQKTIENSAMRCNSYTLCEVINLKQIIIIIFLLLLRIYYSHI